MSEDAVHMNDAWMNDGLDAETASRLPQYGVERKRPYGASQLTPMNDLGG